VHRKLYSRMVQIEGTYVHEKSEGLEAYLGAIGVPWVARKAAANTSPTIQISKEGEEWSLAFKTAIMSNVVKFVLGEEFEEKAPITGEINKGVARMEGENLVITNNTKKGEIKRTMVFTEEGMTMNMHAVEVDARCKRIFKRA